MRVKFGTHALPSSGYLHKTVNDTLRWAEIEILTACRNSYNSLTIQTREEINRTLFNLHQSTDYHTFEAVIKQHRSLSHIDPGLRRKKERKLKKLLNQKQQNKPAESTVQAKKKKCRRFTRKPNAGRPPVAGLQPDSGDTKLVFNISSVALNKTQEEVLALGPKFCPTPLSLDLAQLSKDVTEGCRRVRLKEWHFNSESDSDTCDDEPPPKFYKPTGFQPPACRNTALDTYCSTLQLRTETCTVTKLKRDNLSKEHRHALTELRQMVNKRQIRITSADKGGAVVVQNTSDYITEATRQLNNKDHYQQLKKDPTPQIAKKSNQLVKGLYNRGHIDETTMKWALVEPSTVLCHRLYLLPKIHKSLTNPPGRPIVSGVNGPTENLSKLVDHWLQPVVTDLPSHIQDTTHMLRAIEEWNLQCGPFLDDVHLVTIDVTGLYTNIPHSDIELSLRHFLEGKPLTNAPPMELLLEIVDHVLTNNVFDFDGQLYRQIFGTAMGTPMAPSIANLFMGWLENHILSTSSIPSFFWKRYIDDIFLLWTKPVEELEAFISSLNSFHPTITFTSQHSNSNISFLDITIHLRDGYLMTDIFTKPTDAHGYLHHSSCHPAHVIKNIPYSQFLRLRRLCSDNQTFENRCQEMEQLFRARGYHPRYLAMARQRARLLPRAQTLLYKPKSSNSRPPIVIVHNPANPPIQNWLNELQDNIIKNDTRMKKVLPRPPILGQRNPMTIKNLLMPTALPPPPETDEEPGCVRCTRPHCVICTEHLMQTASFRSDRTGETFHIRSSMSCDTKNLVYLLYCDICPNKQYVGETKNTLKTRFYQHRSNININTGTLVTLHFNQANHSLKNMKCIAVEKVHRENRSVRLTRELFWMKKLQTVSPLGLNILD